MHSAGSTTLAKALASEEVRHAQSPQDSSRNVAALAAVYYCSPAESVYGVVDLFLLLQLLQLHP